MFDQNTSIDANDLRMRGMTARQASQGIAGFPSTERVRPSSPITAVHIASGKGPPCLSKPGGGGGDGNMDKRTRSRSLRKLASCGPSCSDALSPKKSGTRPPQTTSAALHGGSSRSRHSLTPGRLECHRAVSKPVLQSVPPPPAPPPEPASDMEDFKASSSCGPRGS